MPLLPGKKEIGHNIREMQAAGHPHAQAVAAALNVARRLRREGGGSADKGGPQFPSELNGIPLLPHSAEEYRSNPNALIQHLTDAVGDSGEALGLRGIYKAELGLRDLPRSWDDRDPDRSAAHPTSQLEGTSTVGLTGDWSYDPEAVADNFKRHVDHASWFGDTPYLAVVHGRPSIDDIAADKGESVLRDAQTVAYIRRNSAHKATIHNSKTNDHHKHKDKHAQAVAVALGLADRKPRATGGGVDLPRIHKFHSGPIHSHVAGRTDHLPMTVESGSYVLPADVVSAGGEGNTVAGFKTLRRTFGGEPYNGSANPYGGKSSPYNEPLPRATGGHVKRKAAGILFLTPDKEVLLMKRAGPDHHGEWALPAGGIEKGERADEAARRETEEEAGYEHDGGLSPFMYSVKDGVEFTTFIAHCDKFRPSLNDEHDDAKWVSPAEAEKLPLHPGVRAALEKLKRRAAKAGGGETSGVPIVAAGGEWVIPPHHVRQVGNGDLDMGHRVLDHFVRRVRKELIGTLSRLPGPAKD